MELWSLAWLYQLSQVNISARAGGEMLAVDDLAIESGEERLSHRLVVAVADVVRIFRRLHRPARPWRGHPPLHQQHDAAAGDPSWH
jgi:hypothetical protein